MKQGVVVSFFVVFVLLATASPAAAAYFQTGETTTLNQPIHDDAIVAGNTLNVSGEIRGELIGAGQTVTVSTPADRSVVLAGDTVTVSHGADYDAFVAGSTVSLAGTYGHDVYVVGSDVTIKPGTSINGSLYVAGKSLTMAGTVRRNVILNTSTVTFASGSSVGGNLRYANDTSANGLNVVKVHGSTTQLPAAVAMNAAPNATAILARFAIIVALGIAVILLVPKQVTSIFEDVRHQWLRMTGIGLGLLIGVPIFAAFAIATFIAWPVGLIALLFWGIGLFVSAILGVITLGQLVARTKPTNWWIALGLGGLIIVLITSIPVVGPVLRVLAFIMLTLPAFGASYVWWRQLLSRS